MPGPLRDPSPGLRARMRQRFGTGGDEARPDGWAGRVREDEPGADRAPESERPDDAPAP